MNSTLISIVARSSTESYQVSDGFFQPEICVQLFCLATTEKAFLIFPSTFVWILLSSFKISIVILLLLLWLTATRSRSTGLAGVLPMRIPNDDRRSLHIEHGAVDV